MTVPVHVPRLFIYLFVTGICLAIVLLVAGCAGSGPKPISITGIISTADDINPNHRDRPSPVVIHIYQLRTAGSFQAADFFSLFDSAESTLGSDLIASEELELQPGATQDYTREMDFNTHYVGVVAAFRDLENAHWRSIIELPEARSVPLRIALDRLSVSVSAKE